MARSSKSLELDIVTTETLYNRGIPLVPDVTAYYPTLSSLSNAAYYTTVFQGQAQTFSNYFYGLSSFATIREAIVEISTTNLNASTSLALSVSTIDSYSTSTVAFLIQSSNNWGSTPSSFQSNALLSVQIANSNRLFMSNYSTITAPVLSNQIIDSNFYNSNYPPQSASTITIAQQFYGPGYISTQEKYIMAFGNYDPMNEKSSIQYTQDLVNYYPGVLQSDVWSLSKCAEWNGSYFLMGGKNGFPNDLLISYDGIQWSSLSTTVYLRNLIPGEFEPDPQANFQSKGINGLAWDGTQWIAGTGAPLNDFALSNSLLFYSSDALNWYEGIINDTTSLETLTNTNINRVRYNNNRYYAIGGNSNNTLGFIVESTDGESWDRQGVSPGLPGVFNDITFSNDTVLISKSVNTMINDYSVLLYKNPSVFMYSIIVSLLFNSNVLVNGIFGMDYHDGQFVMTAKPGSYTPFPPPPVPIPTTSTFMTLLTTTDIFDAEKYIPYDSLGDPLFAQQGVDVLYTGFNWIIGGSGLPVGKDALVYYGTPNENGITLTNIGLTSAVFNNFQGFAFKNTKPYQAPPSGSRVITLGVSSIVSTLNTEIYASSVLVEYPATLSNTSTSWNSIQTQLQSDLESFKLQVIEALPVFKDTGSTISAVWDSTLISTYAIFSTFDYRDETSSFSTAIYRGFEGASNLLAQRTTAPFLSTFILGMCTTTEFYNPLLLSSWTDRFTIKEPQSTFMSSALKILDSNAATFDSKNSAPIYYNISTVNGTIVAPFVYVVSISTNFEGYGVLSTFSKTAFSTFSTNFPFILGSTVIYDLNIVNSNLSSLSSIFTVTTAGLQSTIDYYNTAVEASSLSSLIFQSPSTFNWQYSRLFSTTNVNIFSNAYSNVNAVPGVSSLASTASGLFSTYTSTITSAFYFLTVDYASSLNGVLYADTQYFSTLNQVGSNISSVISSYQYYSTASSIYDLYSTTHGETFRYISSYNEPDGFFYQALSNNDELYDRALSTLLTSTISIFPIQTLPGYSTNRFNFILRSTMFSQVFCSTFYGVSTTFTSSLIINTPASTSNTVSIRGDVLIQSGGMGAARDPSIVFPNYIINAPENFMSNPSDPRMNLAVQFSSFFFNLSTCEVRHVYNSIVKCLVGINITPTIYSLDLGTGDARKPVGTLWITTSDSRIKTDITSPDLNQVYSSIGDLRLVSYDYISSYIHSHQVKNGIHQLGFISQEVKTIFPNTVYEEPRFGFSNFQSLDIDQIYLAKFAVTQSLLQRLSTANSKVNTLLREF